eukprot:TRINITY_DN7631_c0_g1_i7.p1 TRINITY_DN7631_c0_g1~~TRINITY_DN7631_c0_g1_i7.p1  ORF type:complete len:921 (-),score=153.36 TRINITY_DN7631_c0_g1_i7:68-2830(-)
MNTQLQDVVLFGLLVTCQSFSVQDNNSLANTTGPICSDPLEEYHAHSNQCEKFYQCSHGLPFEKSCPLGTVWAGGNRACDWPHNVQCQKGVRQELVLPAVNSTKVNDTNALFRGCSEFHTNTFISWRTEEIPGIPDFLPANSAPACQQICIGYNECVAWNFHPTFGCNLKKKDKGKRTYPGWSSGARDACRQGCQSASGKYCVFPFKYKGEAHSKCTKEDSKNRAYWCATTVDTNQDVVHGAWEDCGQGCPLDMDEGCRTTTNEECIFPFKFRGRFYKSCTRDYSDNGSPWCATQVNGVGGVLDRKWGDCAKGCPITGGGSKLGLCTNKCSSSTALTSPTGYACYCDAACVKHGDCCTGFQQQCGSGTTGGSGTRPGGSGTGNAFLLGIATGLFKNYPTVRTVLEALNSITNCKNSPQWDFVPGGANLPGHACGLPTLPTIEFLLDVYQQLQDVECSDPRECSTWGCDPYLSVFTSKWFCYPNIRKPNLLNWQSDQAFVNQFLYGINPMHVRKVKSLTEIHQDIRYLKMYDKGVTLSTETFFLNQKLFLADYSFLDSISLHSDFVFYSPQVLFYLNHKGSLELFAILLRTNKGPHSHVMTKFSPPNKFLFAKMHVALADAQSHEFVHHLAMHFMMESVAIARNNYLGTHLIGKLLEPHLQGTIIINFYARHTLIREYESNIEKMFSVGRAGALKLLSENINYKNLVFPKIMSERGFPEDESDGVRNFFYRSDGYQLWNMMSRYVSSIVYRSYTSDTAVLLDNQLQKFASSLASTDLGNIPGFPSFFPTREALVEVLTSIIFTSSVQHQALNAPHHTYSYAPQRPTLLRKWMPSHDGDITWEWIKKALPSIPETEAIYDLANMLAKPSLCTLSNLDMFLPGFEDVGRVFKWELSKLSYEVKRRNHEYDYLDPDKIACSIDI